MKMYNLCPFPSKARKQNSCCGIMWWAHRDGDWMKDNEQTLEYQGWHQISYHSALPIPSRGQYRWLLPSGQFFLFSQLLRGTFLTLSIDVRSLFTARRTFSVCSSQYQVTPPGGLCWPFSVPAQTFLWYLMWCQISPCILCSTPSPSCRVMLSDPVTCNVVTLY